MTKNPVDAVIVHGHHVMGLENHEQACPIVLRLLGMLDEKMGK